MCHTVNDMNKYKFDKKNCLMQFFLVSIRDVVVFLKLEEMLVSFKVTSEEGKCNFQL